MNRRSILGFAVGPIGASALGFVSLPLSTWLFAPDDVGRISMLQTATAIGTVAFTLGLDQSFARQYHQSHQRGALLRTTAWPGLALLLTVALALMALWPEFLSQQMFGIASTSLSAVALLGIIAAYLSRFSSLVLRMGERGLAFSMSQLLPKLLLIACLGVLAFDPRRHFDQLLAAQTASLVAASAIFAWNTRSAWLLKDAPPPSGAPKAPGLPTLLRYGLPMMTAGLAYWTLEAVDKVMLRSLSTFSELGHYSVAMGVASVAATLSTIFTTVWVPTAFKWAEEPNCGPRIAALQRKLVAASLLIVSGAGSLSFVLDWLLPASYGPVRELLALCMLPALFYAVSEVTGIGAAIAHRSGLVLLSAVITAAVNVALNFWLIPLWGAGGAATATSLSFFLMLILRTESSAMSWQSLPRAGVYAPLAIVGVLAIMHAHIGRTHPVVVQALWMMVFGGAVWHYRNALLEIFGQLRHREAQAVG
ncbi:lipopolysaccharide biosynthesis protein [Roseateles sp.]|uniref:lipopolysaccharide biosynthesis protein n=1 Tax=Roseateles sp. TaxID=1971397 RepID=UPI003D1029D6